MFVYDITTNCDPNDAVRKCPWLKEIRVIFFIVCESPRNTVIWNTKEMLPFTYLCQKVRQCRYFYIIAGPENYKE